MPAPDPSKVILVPVKRHDVNLSLQEVLTPLTQMSASLAQRKAAPAAGSELDQQVQQLSKLAHQLLDVVKRINKADPTLLSPTTPEPPRRR